MKSKPRTRAQEMAWEAVDQALLGSGSRGQRAERFFALIERRASPKEPTLGEELKKRRQALKLTPVKAADRAAVPAARWRLWEANLGLPTQDELAGVTRALGEERLWLLWRKAPRVVLGRVLDTRPTLKVARRSGEPQPLTAREHWRLAVVNLDPQLRAALERHVRASGGAQPDEETLAALLESASALTGSRKELWVREIVGEL